MMNTSILEITLWILKISNGRYAPEREVIMSQNEKLLRLLELLEIYIDTGVLKAEFEVFASDDDNIVNTIDDLIKTMETEMSYWD